MMQDTATRSTIFGLPVIKMAFTVGESSKIFTYTESVIPILLAVILLALLERLLNKIVPEILQLILVPGLSLLIMVPVMLVVVGPVGIYVATSSSGSTPHCTASAPFWAVSSWAACGASALSSAHTALSLPIGLNDVP